MIKLLLETGAELNSDCKQAMDVLEFKNMAVGKVS